MGLWCTRSEGWTAFAPQIYPGAAPTGSRCLPFTVYPRPTALKIPAMGVPGWSWCECVKPTRHANSSFRLVGGSTRTHPLLAEVPPGGVY